MNEIVRLPLFPLPTVVFPGQTLPLHIFEPRYRLMIAHCRQAVADRYGTGRFAVVLSSGPHVFTTGCSVDISRVAAEYPDGRLDIVTRGVQRVLIHDVASEHPYVVANVEFLADASEEPLDRGLREQVLALATRLTEEICDEPIVLAVPPGESAAYRLAGLTGMDLPQRQRLLEERHENRRLALIRDALQESLTRMLANGRDLAPPGGYVH